MLNVIAALVVGVVSLTSPAVAPQAHAASCCSSCDGSCCGNAACACVTCPCCGK